MSVFPNLRKGLWLSVAFLTVLLALVWQWWPAPPWTEAERGLMNSLWLGNLPPVPPDPGNAVADVPLAAEIGHRLFFDERLSRNAEVSCATCHKPELHFTDGLQKAAGIGRSGRNTMSIVGSAWSPWQYWDGRKDSQWSQALSPLEDPQEQGSNRMRLARLIVSLPEYRDAYAALFGTVPDFSDRQRFPDDASPLGEPDWQAAWSQMAEADRHLVNQVFANIGKLLAAYERQIIPGGGRFDDYVAALNAGDQALADTLMDSDERAGLRLFMGKGRCIECHNGPLFTNNEFHNTGILSFPGEVPDVGRSAGLRTLLQDPFNCLGEYSDDARRQCPELRYVRSGIELLGAFRTPGLRNLNHTAPYMHKGQMWSLEDILEHYNRAPLAMIGHNEAEDPLKLSRRELDQLEAFLHTLNGVQATETRWLAPPM